MNVREIVRVESSRVSAQSRRCHFLWEEGTDPQQDRAFAVKNNFFFFPSQRGSSPSLKFTLRDATRRQSDCPFGLPGSFACLYCVCMQFYCLLLLLLQWQF